MDIKGGRRGRCAQARRESGERGAAAVEFALVSVLVFPILFGILDYGLWFNDSLASRQGVREAARTGVVQGTPASGCTSGDYLEKIACTARAQVNAVSGNTYARVETGSSGWVKGAPLVVCTIVKSDGVTGLVPLPNDRLIRSKTQMAIENADSIPTGVTASDFSTSGGSLPSGANWDFCS